LDAGKNLVGPSLAAIVGKKAASDPGFNYSPALKGANLTWDVATLDAYLLDPQKLVPGNRMPFPGLKTENERKDIIAYLAASSASQGTAQPAGVSQAPRQSQAPAAASPQPPAAPTDQRSVSYIPDIRYTLRSGIAEGRMVFLGVGGTIDGQVNPI